MKHAVKIIMLLSLVVGLFLMFYQPWEEARYEMEEPVKKEQYELLDIINLGEGAIHSDRLFVGCPVITWVLGDFETGRDKDSKADERKFYKVFVAVHARPSAIIKFSMDMIRVKWKDETKWCHLTTRPIFLSLDLLKSNREWTWGYHEFRLPNRYFPQRGKTLIIEFTLSSQSSQVNEPRQKTFSYICHPVFVSGWCKLFHIFTAQ